MMMGPLYALCDAIKAACDAAQPTWTVSVITDPQQELRLEPETEFELHIGPGMSEEERGEEERGGISRKRADGVLTICLRMRSKLKAADPETEIRRRAMEWDKVVRILQRRSGFNLGSDFGDAIWLKGEGVPDRNALRKDRVIAILSLDTQFLIHRKTA